jgi:ribonuclease III
MPRRRPKRTARAAAASPARRADPAELESALGHRFADRTLLERALTHRSYAHEKGHPDVHSESLEFLGDAVLALGVSQMLCRRFEEVEVGDLSRARSFLVSEANLARKARSLGLGAHLRLGRGEEKGGGREKDSLLSDAYEALLAAVYLDAGLSAAMSVVSEQFSSQVSRLKPGARTSQDFKTDLQEALQAVGLPIPVYRVTGETGPDHRKTFSVDLTIAGRRVAHGSGTSKKAAEQMAAEAALGGVEDLIAELTSDEPGTTRGA